MTRDSENAVTEPRWTSVRIADNSLETVLHLPDYSVCVCRADNQISST
jgi:hypothetical protein